MNYFIDALDAIDAAVFSGDALESPENRDMFEEFMNSWQRAIAERRQSATTNQPEDKT